MDFVDALLNVKRLNALLSTTHKATKSLLLIPRTFTKTAEEQAITLIDRLLADWGVPGETISDRDSKFKGTFWKAVSRRIDTNILTTAPWYTQADGQSERPNQIVKFALRSAIANHPTALRVDLIAAIQASPNNSTSYSTESSPTEMMYNFRLRRRSVLLLERQYQIYWKAKDNVAAASHKALSS